MTMNKKLLFRMLALVVAMMCALGANAAEAYANYTPSNTTLTFYYDNQFTTRPGTTYRLYSGEEAPGWYNIRTSVTQVEFDPSFADATPTGAFYWFYEMSNLQSITGIEYLNTSNMTDMNGMFAGCSGLTSLDVSHFDTSNSTDMGGMFSGCSGLSVIDVSHFNTAKVENMWGMFQGCTGLTTLDLGSFNISKVKYISYMFNGCSNLTTIYAGYGWHGDAVEECNYMFTGCTKLVGGQGTRYFSSPDEANYACIDRPANNCPGWLTGKCYAVYTPDNTTLTFYNDCLRSSRNGTIYELHQWSLYNQNENPEWYLDNTYGSVTHVVFDPSFADARPTTTNNLFYRMTSLQSITGMDKYLNTEDVVNTSRMFQACLLLTSLDLSHFNTANVNRMNNMFSGSSKLTTIYAGDEWSTAAVTNSNAMFNGCTSLVGGQGTAYDADHVDAEYAHIDGGTANPGYFTEKVDFLRGDVNGDNNVSIGDVTTLIDLLLSGGVINNPAADCNQDENVSIGDVTALIDYLLGGSW